MEINYRKKITLKETRDGIIKDYNAGMTIKDLMKKYGFSHTTIYNVLRGEYQDKNAVGRKM